jgi:hypothetical protein
VKPWHHFFISTFISRWWWSHKHGVERKPLIGFPHVYAESRKVNLFLPQTRPHYELLCNTVSVNAMWLGVEELEPDLPRNSPDSVQQCIEAASRQSWFSCATLFRNNESKPLIITAVRTPNVLYFVCIMRAQACVVAVLPVSYCGSLLPLGLAAIRNVSHVTVYPSWYLVRSRQVHAMMMSLNIFESCYLVVWCVANSSASVMFAVETRSRPVFK